MSRALASALLAAACLAACGPKAPPETHSAAGVIREVRFEGAVLVIEHEEIPGFMEAMTMPFKTADPSLAAGLRPGDKVRFTITRKGSSWPITAIEKEGG